MVAGKGFEEAAVDDEDAHFTYCNEMNRNCCRFAAFSIQCPSLWALGATGQTCSLSDNEVVPFYGQEL